MCHTLLWVTADWTAVLGVTGESWLTLVNSRHLALGKVCTSDFVTVGGVSSDAGAHLSNPTDTATGGYGEALAECAEMLTMLHVLIGADV